MWRIFPQDNLLCGEISPHDRFLHRSNEKCGEYLLCGSDHFSNFSEVALYHHGQQGADKISKSSTLTQPNLH